MSVPTLDHALRDARVGLRGMLRNWGFTLTASVSLALGIAAATAMYSVIHAVVLDPFPYKDVDNLMSIKVWDPGQRGYRTYYAADQYVEFRDRSTIFDGIIASTISDVVWTGGGDPQRLRGNHGPFDTFDVMGVPPLIGRTPSAADAAPGAPQVAVLGYRFWQRQFGGDPGVLGRKLTLNGVVREVIGVMPRRFMWRGADVYLPIHFRRGQQVEGVNFVHVLGRLKQGITEARAEADLRPIVEDLKKLQPQAFPDKWRVGLLPFKETFPSGIRSVLWILFGATGLLLLIACANVSNLLLSRAAGRRREMAIRASMGASRLRLLRQLLTESLMLALAGGALGIGLAYATLRAILSIVPPNTIPDEAQITMNVPVLLFSAGVSVLTAILFGLAPAVSGCAPNLVEPLKSGARDSGGSRGLLRSALVVAEVALSLMLLAGAAQMFRALFRLQSIDLGFAPERILAMRVPLSETRYPEPERRNIFFRDVLARVRSVPGVAAASVSSGLHPFGGWGMRVEVPGGVQDKRGVRFSQVDADYLSVYGFRLAAGRPMTEQEVAAGLRVALVNQAFVQRFLPERSALGAAVRIPSLAEPPFQLADVGFQIVGILRDALNSDPRDGVQPEILVPYTTLGRAGYLLVRSALDPAAVTKAVASQVYAVDRDQPIADIRTIEDTMQMWVLARPRFNLILFGVFASLGLVLATVGVYGVISNSVAQRTREIGLRMALGASFPSVAGMVLRRGLTLVGIGLALGLGAAYGAGRLLANQMRDLGSFDVAGSAVVSAVLLFAGFAACLWPARRAARIDPGLALRNE